MAGSSTPRPSIYLPGMTCSVPPTLLASHVVACPATRCQWAADSERRGKSGPQSRFYIPLVSTTRLEAHVPLFGPLEKGCAPDMQEKLREKVLEEWAKKGRRRHRGDSHLPAASLTAQERAAM